jgi:repressor LexA
MCNFLTDHSLTHKIFSVNKKVYLFTTIFSLTVVFLLYLKYNPLIRSWRDMYSFGNEIKKLRIKHNLKQEEFAEILTEEAERYEKQTGDKVKPEKGFKKGVISRWENDVVEPRIDIVRLVSKAFNIDANILLGIASEEDVSEVYEAEVTNVPLIGSIAAGEPIFVEENIEGYIPVIKSSLKKGKTYFFMTVKGESMNREFKTGSKESYV